MKQIKDNKDQLATSSLNERERKKPRMVGVRVDFTGKTDHFFCGRRCHYRVGDRVIVGTSGGFEIGDVSYNPIPIKDPNKKYPPVIRKTTEEDLRRDKKNQKLALMAHNFCREQIKRLGLDMKLLKTVYSYSGKKAIFYFTAAQRVDFRELVKVLVEKLGIRIELRHIGARDAAKLIGGLGPCGRMICCFSFMESFQPISLNLAKVQNLVINTQKLTGICGNLKCCLAHEYETYQELSKGMPQKGQRVRTPSGEGVITAVDVLKGVIFVTIDEAVHEFKKEDVIVLEDTEGDNNAQKE